MGGQTTRQPYIYDFVDSSFHRVVSFCQAQPQLITLPLSNATSDKTPKCLGQWASEKTTRNSGKLGSFVEIFQIWPSLIPVM